MFDNESNSKYLDHKVFILIVNTIIDLIKPGVSCDCMLTTQQEVEKLEKVQTSAPMLKVMNP